MEHIKDSKNSLIAILFFFLCLFLFTKLLGPIPFSINSIETTKNSFFTVDGVGEEKAVPDTASVSLGVSIKAPTAEQAKNQMNEVTNNVVDALKNLGIEEKDIKTTNFSVYEDMSVKPVEPVITEPGAVRQPVVQSGKVFVGSQNIEVKTKTIELANQAIDTASKLGANAIGTPTFVLNEKVREELIKKARKKAIENAKKKAQELASEAGIRLGKVVDIREGGGGGTYYKTMDARAESGAANQTTELNPGEDTIMVSVTLSYETL